MTLPLALFLEEADFTALDVLHEYIGYAGSFCIVGAAAFYFLLLRPSVAQGSALRATAARTAAWIGTVGALLRLGSIAMSVNSIVAEKHISLVDALTRRPVVLVGEIVTLLALLAFAGAAVSASGGLNAWIVAGVCTLAIMFRGVFTTELEELVNPIHVFAASMWIGTLFVMLVAGIAGALGGTLSAEDNGGSVAKMVHRFSTIALWSAGVLVLTGVTTAYLHIGTWNALLSSTYGQTLLTKLAFVACVFATGAWNYKRIAPTLGTMDAARRMKRSATLEVVLASVVLAITAVLVNLPAPAEHMAH